MQLRYKRPARDMLWNESVLTDGQMQEIDDFARRAGEVFREDLDLGGLKL